MYLVGNHKPMVANVISALKINAKLVQFERNGKKTANKIYAFMNYSRCVFVSKFRICFAEKRFCTNFAVTKKVDVETADIIHNNAGNDAGGGVAVDGWHTHSGICA